MAPLLRIHKGYLPGAIGRIVGLHATFYQRQANFGLRFESRVARELSDFCERYDDDRDGLWLALNEDQVEGSIAIDGLGAKENGAHLRWFICSDSARGTGMGTALLTAAIAFCRSRCYELVSLRTFEGLGAARHLYEKFGFKLVHEQRGAEWGVEVNEQRFELRAAVRLA